MTVTPKGVRMINENVIQEGRGLVVTDRNAIEWNQIPDGSLYINPGNGVMMMKIEGETDWVPAGIRNDGTLVISRDTALEAEVFTITNLDNGDGTFTYRNADNEQRYKAKEQDGYVFELENGTYFPGRNHLSVLVNGSKEYTAATGEIIELDHTRFKIVGSIAKNDKLLVRYIKWVKIGNPYPRIFMGYNLPTDAEVGDLFLDLSGTIAGINNMPADTGVWKYKLNDGWHTLYEPVFVRFLDKDKNLSDITNAETARTNLGLFGDNNTTHYHDSRYMQRAEIQQTIDGINNSITVLTTTYAAQLESLRNDLNATMAGYAKKDASNISNADAEYWSPKIAIGLVSANSTNAVPGNAVYASLNGLRTDLTDMVNMTRSDLSTEIEQKLSVYASGFSDIISGRNSNDINGFGKMWYWYRVYSDGWTEQGGHFERETGNSSLTQTITLPIAMRDAYYTLVLSNAFNGSAMNHETPPSSYAKDTTSFSFHTASNDFHPTDWYLIGYCDLAILNDNARYLFVYKGEHYEDDSSSWSDTRPAYELYVDDVLQTPVTYETERSESGYHVVSVYDQYSIPIESTVKYLSTNTYSSYDVRKLVATACHWADGVTTSYTTRPVTFEMGFQNLTIDDMSGQIRIGVTANKGNRNPFVKVSHTTANNTVFMSRRYPVGERDSFDMKYNTKVTFTADGDSDYIYIYQDGRFKAEITGTASWSSANLTQDTEFEVRGYSYSYYYVEDSYDDCCVAEGTLITCYEDGNYVQKKIENIESGETVVGANGELNEVYARTDTVLGKDRSMFTFEDETLYFTGEHSMWVKYDGEEYFGIHDMTGYIREATTVVDNKPILEWEQEKTYRKNGIIGKPISKGLSRQPILVLRTAEYGTDKGWKQNKAIIAKDKVYPAETPVHTLIVGGNHTYFANGYLVSGFATDADYDYSQVKIEDLKIS